MYNPTTVADIHVRRGCRPYYDIYIGRRVPFHREFTEDSKWANRSPSLEEYEQHVRANLWDDLHELRGKVLGCWCVTTRLLRPLMCHGQVLMKLVEQKFPNTYYEWSKD